MGTAKNGYSMTFDVPKDTWEYVDLSLTAGEFLNATDTSGYKVMIATDITELFTTQLWFGVDDIDQTDAAGEIDSGATGMGRGDRSGEGSAPGAGDYVLSIYATCDGCNDVTVELQMYLVDAGVDAVAGGINYAITTGINEEPTVAGSFTFPSVIAVAIAAVAAIFAL